MLEGAPVGLGIGYPNLHFFEWRGYLKYVHADPSG